MKPVQGDRYQSIWDAIEGAPDEAATMKVKSTLMRTISSHIRARGLSSTEAATEFRSAQFRIEDLMQGKIEKFSIDDLVTMMAAAGLETPAL